MEGNSEVSGPLSETEAKFKEFVPDRSEMAYHALVEVFVFEVMGTNRTACFPLTEDVFKGLTEKNSEFPFGFAIVRDPQGVPFAAFLTSHKMSCGPYPISAEIVASAVVVHHLFKEPGISGIALNPWNDGGAFIPKELFLQAMAKLDGRLGLPTGDLML
ncbi:MAG: hypothetical protein IKQ17_13385 [Kiritimatiellae bacterium]|nr:hypothetical protein [Kiritimatiellia bacterium]